MRRSNKHKEVDKTKYLLALTLTIIVFSSGVLLGTKLNSKKFERLGEIENSIKLQTLGAELQYQIIITNPCQFINSTPLTEELYELAEKLSYLESDFGEDDPRVLSLKEQYSLLELKHWLFIERTNKECGRNLLPVLYFYSNKGDCPKCEEQGYILTYIRKKYSNVRVYSFDINIDNPALNTVKKIYDIEYAPSIIVKSTVYPQFMPLKSLENIFSALSNLNNISDGEAS